MRKRRKKGLLPALLAAVLAGGMVLPAAQGVRAEETAEQIAEQTAAQAAEPVTELISESETSRMQEVSEETGRTEDAQTQLQESESGEPDTAYPVSQEAVTGEEDTSREEEAAGKEAPERETSAEDALQSEISSAEQRQEAVTETVSCYCVGYAAEDVPVYVQSSEQSGVLVTMPEGTKLSVIAVLFAGDDEAWYQITFAADDYCYEGFVRPEYIFLENAGISTYALGSGDRTGEFPEDYQALIAELKSVHPNWSFQPLYVGLDFNAAVEEEQKVVNRNLVASSQIADWKSFKMLGTDKEGAVYNYNWQTDTFYEWEPGVVAASDEAVAYCMDPRNFINEKYIFMFESLSYQAEYQTVSAVNTLLKGTFMYNANVPGESYTYAWLLHWIGEKYNINPVMLASRLRQEQGIYGTSELISGTYPGYENLYNYFNIMASGHTREEIVETGLTIAKTGSSMILPTGESYNGSWDTPTKSMIGGALNIANKFILVGQNTLYLQKFDVDNSDGKLYWHQYMQNIQAPMSEGSTVRRSYTEMGLIDEAFVFTIPVFENMPASTKTPTSDDSPNNCLQSILVDGTEVITEFDKDTLQWEITVPGDTESVSIEVKTASSKAVLECPDSMQLQKGKNSCSITVTAQNGEARAYTLTVICGQDDSGEDTQTLEYGELLVEDTTVYIGLKNQKVASVYIPYYVLNLSEDESCLWIDGVQQKTDAETFLKNINVTGNIWAGLFDEETLEQKSGKDPVGTGTVLVITDHETGEIVMYSPIISHGDVDGDGFFDVVDFSLGKAYLLGRKQFTESQMLAADIDGDGIYDIVDFSLMKAVLLGRQTLKQ